MDGLFLKYLLCRKVIFWFDKLLAFHIFQHCISRFNICELVTFYEMKGQIWTPIYILVCNNWSSPSIVICSKIENVLAFFDGC